MRLEVVPQRIGTVCVFEFHYGKKKTKPKTPIQKYSKFIVIEMVRKEALFFSPLKHSWFLIMQMKQSNLATAIYWTYAKFLKLNS